VNECKSLELGHQWIGTDISKSMLEVAGPCYWFLVPPSLVSQCTGTPVHYAQMVSLMS